MTAPPAEWRKGGSCEGAHSSFAPSAISRHSALRPSCAIIPRTSHREHRLTILIASHARAHTHTHTQTSRLRWRAVMSQQSATNSAVAVRATRDPSSKRTVLYELAPSNSALDEVCARRGGAGEMGWCSLRTAFDACASCVSVSAGRGFRVATLGDACWLSRPLAVGVRHINRLRNAPGYMHARTGYLPSD